MNMFFSKTSDHIQIKIQIANLSQEPPASPKAQNQELKDIDIICTFKIKIAKFWIIGVPKTNGCIEIKIKMPNPSQEPPAFSRAPNQDVKDPDVLCNFKINLESQNIEHGCTNNQ